MAAHGLTNRAQRSGPKGSTPSPVGKQPAADIVQRCAAAHFEARKIPGVPQSDSCRIATALIAAVSTADRRGARLREVAPHRTRFQQRLNQVHNLAAGHGDVSHRAVAAQLGQVRLRLCAVEPVKQRTGHFFDDWPGLF